MINIIENPHLFCTVRTMRALAEQLQLDTSGLVKSFTITPALSYREANLPDTHQGRCGGRYVVTDVLKRSKEFLHSHIAVVRLFNSER